MNYTRKLGKIGRESGGSYYVTLPLEEIKNLGWREGQRLTVRKAKSKPGLVIEDWTDQN